MAATDLLHGGEPEGAFYAFARYDVDLGSEEVTRLLLRNGVAVRAGNEYGPSGDGAIRLSFATDLDTLETGISRITSTLGRLREERGVGPGRC